MTRVAVRAKTAAERPLRAGSTQGSHRAAASADRAAASGQRRGKAPATRVQRSTTGTKAPVIRSARAWMGTLPPWASRTRAVMRARKESSPTRSARISREPLRQRDPPVTLSPGALGTGRGSPVSRDSSTAAVPSRTVPSAGIRSPGATRRDIPAFTASMGTESSVPSSRTHRASRAERESSARTSLAARSRRFVSIPRPVSWKARIMAPTAPKDSRGSPAAERIEVRTAVPAPRETSTSMFAWAWVRAIRAPRRIPRPAPSSTAVERRASRGRQRGRWTRAM